MKAFELKRALRRAVTAAQGAGALMQRNLRSVKKVHETHAHDIKLELDVRCQKLIAKELSEEFPEAALFGEEGMAGDAQAEYRWVVDPIDGTVNFAYGIPHACVSIALQHRTAGASAGTPQDYVTWVGVVYDPFCNELWTGIRGQAARLNGRPIQVSHRRKLSEAVISIGFAKLQVNLEKMLPRFQHLVPKVRKIRIMGAAALDLVYVASGRLDAYIESGVKLWDIAAGGLIVECAGGEFCHEPIDQSHTYHLLANNGLIRKQLEKFL